MYNLIWADLFKIRKSMAIKVLFAITTVCAVVMGVMSYLIQQGKIDASMTGIGFLFSDMDVMNILGGVIAGVFICGDFDNKTIHDAVASGCSRVSIIVSKAVAFFCALIFILLPYVIVAGIALSTGSKFNMGSVALGFLHLITTDAGKALSAAEAMKLFGVMLTLIILYCAQLSVCLPLAIMLKKPVLVVAINYGVSILCAQLMSLRGTSALFDKIFAYTPFGGNYPFITLNTGTGDLFKAIFVSIIFIIVMLAITYFGFRKSEIK